MCTASNYKPSNQVWSTYFSCNTAFVARVCFPWRVSLLLPAVILSWRVFAYRSLCLTTLSVSQVLWIALAVCWLPVIGPLISTSFNAEAIKFNTEEWSFGRLNTCAMILHWFCLFVQIRLGKRLNNRPKCQHISGVEKKAFRWTVEYILEQPIVQILNKNYRSLTKKKDTFG